MSGEHPKRWEHNLQAHVIQSVHGEFVVDCNHVAPANIRLITAAPLMLEALEALTDPEGHIPHGTPGGPCTGECKAARAAIAKARG